MLKTIICLTADFLRHYQIWFINQSPEYKKIKDRKDARTSEKIITWIMQDSGIMHQLLAF